MFLRLYAICLITFSLPLMAQESDVEEKIKNYSNGKIMEKVRRKNGRRHGLCVTYYLSGGVQDEISYHEGKKHGECRSYRENGNIWVEQKYKHGQLDGLSRDYYENGKIKNETPYVNDKIEGVYKEFYSTGQVKIKAHYKNDKKEGIEERFDTEGQLIKKLDWKQYRSKTLFDKEAEKEKAFHEAERVRLQEEADAKVVAANEVNKEESNMLLMCALISLLVMVALFVLKYQMSGRRKVMYYVEEVDEEYED